MSESSTICSAGTLVGAPVPEPAPPAEEIAYTPDESPDDHLAEIAMNANNPGPTPAANTTPATDPAMKLGALPSVPGTVRPVAGANAGHRSTLAATASAMVGHGLRAHIRRGVVAGAAMTLVGVALAGCEDRSNVATVARDTKQNVKNVERAINSSQAQAVAMANSMAGDSNFFEIGDVKFPTPAGWAKQPAGGMRLAEFKVTGDDGPASVVFFSTGGDATSNIERWKGQVKALEGGEPRTQTLNVGSFKITRVAMVGTYSGMGPGGAPVPPAANSKFIGAIIEPAGGGQQIQVRFVGPRNTVEDAEKAFDAMVAGVQSKR